MHRSPSCLWDTPGKSSDHGQGNCTSWGQEQSGPALPCGACLVWMLEVYRAGTGLLSNPLCHRQHQELAEATTAPWQDQKEPQMSLCSVSPSERDCTKSTFGRWSTSSVPWRGALALLANWLIRELPSCSSAAQLSSLPSLPPLRCSHAKRPLCLPQERLACTLSFFSFC